jgi:hypothetical protein
MVSPGELVTVVVTGTPGARALLFSGPSMGQTTLGGPLATTLCLAAPYRSLLLGGLPHSGTRSFTVRTPHFAPIGSQLHYQAVTLAHGRMTDTSPLASVSFVAAGPCLPGSVVLDIQPDVPVQPGNTVTISVTGTPGAHVLLFTSHNLGSTSVRGAFTLCLDPRISVRAFGTIPAGGTLSHSFTVPAGAMLPGNRTLHYQAVEVVTDPSGRMFDTSNLDMLTF